MNLFASVKYKINNFENSINKISPERKELLNSLAEYIAGKLKDDKEINLIFICTHNSRRSIMSQIWAQTLSDYFNIQKVNCYSGGTESTSFNIRAIKAVRRAGFKVIGNNNSINPLYLVYYSDENKPVKCFSKIYSHKANPQKDFAAIMTCSDADLNCPVVIGSEVRFPVNYKDPKEFDYTKFEEEKYDERFEEIGRELFYTFNKVNYLVKK